MSPTEGERKMFAADAFELRVAGFDCRRHQTLVAHCSRQAEMNSQWSASLTTVMKNGRIRS